jgi:phosphoribosylformylglycinamidine synthase PurS subunit
MRARVTVTLKSGVLDPQGKAIEGALRSLGVDGIAAVRQGKLFDIEVEAGTSAEAEATLRQACERLLANTVVENYRIEIDQSTADQPRETEGASETEAVPAADLAEELFAPDTPVEAAKPAPTGAAG